MLTVLAALRAAVFGRGVPAHGVPAFGGLRLARGPLASFVAMGVLWGCFAADLPDIKTMLDLSETELGLLLFMTPIAAMGAMVAAPLIGQGLGRWALPVTTAVMAAAFALPGQASVWWWFPVAMLACGAGTGALDVLMNTRVAMLEAAPGGRPIMNLCFAGYSFGYAGGALGAGQLRALGWGPDWVMGAMALVAVLLAVASVEADGRIEGLARPKGGAATGLGWVPVLGGAVVLIAFLTENASENWSALFIEQDLGGTPVLGALGPASLALTMGCARLAGQGLASRFRPGTLLVGGALIAACGALAAAMAATPAAAYAGFIVMGIGGSVISPTTFGLVGALARPEARARAVARATMLGYFGYFVGPPGVGFIAGAFGLRAAFVLVALMLLVVPILARLLAAAAQADGQPAAARGL